MARREDTAALLELGAPTTSEADEARYHTRTPPITADFILAKLSDAALDFERRRCLYEVRYIQSSLGPLLAAKLAGAGVRRHSSVRDLTDKRHRAIIALRQARRGIAKWRAAWRAAIREQKRRAEVRRTTLKQRRAAPNTLAV